MEKCVYLSEVMRMNDINELNIEVKYSENTEKETKEIETKVFIKLEHMLNRFNEAHAPFTLLTRPISEKVIHEITHH